MQKRKPTKTLSGVTPLAVMLPPRPCPHGTCLYCPTFHTQKKANGYTLTATNSSEAPQSYTPQSPAVIRARECNYDPAKQIKARLKSYKVMNHPTQKIELIIMGGTFLAYPKQFQIDFITKCYQALNGKANKREATSAKQQAKNSKNFFTNATLEKEKQINQTAKHRCVALCIETRPDYCTQTHINDILTYGATRVELGVQAIDNSIYKKVNRGHAIQDVIDATLRLKQAGFKVGYHIMPGIPGSTPKKDIQMFKKLFKSPNFKPDQIKIYPCQVLKGSGLENLYYQGEYIPYDKQTTQDIIIQMLHLTPRYVRIMRIMREIPPHYLIAGIKNIDMRHDIEKNLRYFPDKRNFHVSPKQVFLLARNFFFLKRKKSKNIDMRHDIEKNLSKTREKIQEIRFREIGLAIRDGIKINPKTKIKTTKYKASNATEYFIEITNPQNILFGLLRLRLEKNKPAMIRELHVYGQALNLNAKDNSSQHSGYGKQLMQKAEQISKKKHHKKILVISGIGVREYYKNLGYRLDKQKIYMEKEI